MALQETHIDSEKLKFYIKTLAPGYNAIASSALGRKRGVALLFKEDFQLLASGEDEQGRYVWGHFKVRADRLHVASIYAPNLAGERILFWERLRQQLPSAHWLALGDWNAVGSTADSSSRSNIQADDEAAVFQDLCNTLGVLDARPLAAKTEDPKFTRAQFRHGKFSWSRIDCIYVPEYNVLKLTHHSSPREQTPREVEAVNTLLSDSSERISTIQAVMLQEVPSEKKVFESLLLLPEGKSPGPDGMGPEILKLLWPVIGETYYGAVLEFWSSGSLLPFFKEGLIYLISKTQDPDLGAFGFPYGFYLRGEGSAGGANSRILLNGHQLPPFTIARGVRQGCPLSPLRYVIASIPIIRLKAENGRDRILPVKIQEGCFVSCMCLVDDLAIFTELHENSVANILQLLDLVEVASGGKVNILKSKILMLGKQRRFPTWLSSLEFRLADKQDVTIYLGAPLTTVWRGTDNGRNLLDRLARKAEFFFSPTLSFESRVVALRHEARRSTGPRESREIANDTYSWCLNRGVVTPAGLQLFLTTHTGHDSAQNLLPSQFVRSWLSNAGTTTGGSLSLGDWSTGDNLRLDPSWTASKIYECLRAHKRQPLCRWLNNKWRLERPLIRWESCWKYVSIKGLSQRHKCFIWRILAAAFYVGKNARRFGFHEFSCKFCGGGVEDISHAVWLCPRWRRFWLEVSTKVHGCQHLATLREDLSLLPQVLL
ncbi:hypothetical protein R1sor_018276 [Riccia sorocarpa]|uniref:Endonuclease/exonuclease/phosphatase domain-containing protein n=1 Tax=Riccia sorocarpa TaxID=122646 RepID=A0ABD3IAX9_9MARC